MHGTRYISKIREDLTFEVYNLYPDYIYPGKIVSVDIKVEGEPEADKLVTVEIQTHTENELDYANFIGVSCKNGNFGFHITLLPIDEAGNPIDKGYRFRGQTTVSKHLKSGHYVPPKIAVGILATMLDTILKKIMDGNCILIILWKIYILQNTFLIPPVYLCLMQPQIKGNTIR